MGEWWSKINSPLHASQLIRIIKLLGTDRTKQEEQLTANTLFDTIAEMVQDGCPRGTTVRR